MSPAPLLGITQIARRLGMSRQRVHKLTERGDFPAPSHTLSTGRVWRERDIERWVARHPRYDHTLGVVPPAQRLRELATTIENGLDGDADPIAAEWVAELRAIADEVKAA